MTPTDWPPDQVTQLLSSDDRFEQVTADGAYARRILDAIIEAECELALYAAFRGRWAKANTLTYDAARKSVEALLLAVGWRIRPVVGAHAAATEVVHRWLGDQPVPGPRMAEKFAASRKARHDDEYPHPAARPRTKTELLALAQDNVRIVNRAREILELPPRPDLVPTAENIDAFRGR